MSVPLHISSHGCLQKSPNAANSRTEVKPVKIHISSHGCSLQSSIDANCGSEVKLVNKIHTTEGM